MLWLILAIVAWGVIHSLLASTACKDLWRRTFGDRFMRFYRLFYNIFAVISVLPVLYLVLTVPDKALYQAPVPFNFVLRAGQIASILFLFAAVMQTDILSFAGLRQLFEEEKSGKLIIGGLYRYVRHPLYTFSLSILWLSPNMSRNSLIVYAVLTIYVLIGIIFEERKLIREFGQQYEVYRESTPMLIPRLRFGWNK